jgi:hypothetical protein
MSKINRSEIVASFIDTLSGDLRKRLANVPDERITASDAFRAFKKGYKASNGPSKPRLSPEKLATILLADERFTQGPGLSGDEIDEIVMNAGYVNKHGDAAVTSVAVHLGAIGRLRVPGLLGPESLIGKPDHVKRPGQGRNPLAYRATGPEAVALLRKWSTGGELPPLVEPAAEEAGDGEE